MQNDKVQRLFSRRQFLGKAVVKSIFTAGAISLPFTQKALSSTKESQPVKPNKFQRNSNNPPSPPFAVRVLNKAGFGAKVGDIDAFNALADNDDDRLIAWVDRQLNPTASDPELDRRFLELNGTAYSTINKTKQQLWDEHYNSGQFHKRHLPQYEMERLIVFRSLYSQWQLRELLNDFWFNHFNVYAQNGPAQSMLPDYDREIRSNIFGNFYDMLLDTSKSSSMLFYLDNYINTWPDPNENYARELMELHTLGAIENSYEDATPNAIGNNIKGQRKGYTETDVRQFARALTGWSYDFITSRHAGNGAFTFNADLHYDGHLNEPIKVMDITINHNTGENDVTVILKYLADHYGTARFISKKLCQRLISDNPSETLIASTAEIFYNNRNEVDQLAKVYRHILLSGEFKTSWGEKIKRPLETIVSAMRAADVNINYRYKHVPSTNIHHFLVRAGQGPYKVSPPTGYSDEKPNWSATTPLLASWQAVTYFCAWGPATDKSTGNPQYYFCHLGEQSNALIPNQADRTPENLVDDWMMRLRGYHYDNDTRNHLINFVADKAGVARNVSLHTVMNTNNLSNNLFTYPLICSTLVGLILTSADAMRR
ncbi:MAG: DUF1800 domain-containing protein [Cocleimonas sp.]|nr:DUF1800 domain-containing protein [Cocleimonas sp.]